MGLAWTCGAAIALCLLSPLAASSSNARTSESAGDVAEALANATLERVAAQGTAKATVDPNCPEGEFCCVQPSDSKGVCVPSDLWDDDCDDPCAKYESGGQKLCMERDPTACR
mmetsp:Transcript_6013/g.13679  ORF Transcript_6013/g.13679 Transcript_6013/m.13679 type:complete len:113 (-) Transcript_6013:169-507(-)